LSHGPDLQLNSSRLLITETIEFFRPARKTWSARE
jgi:hypothetical protein